MPSDLPLVVLNNVGAAKISADITATHRQSTRVSLAYFGRGGPEIHQTRMRELHNTPITSGM